MVRGDMSGTLTMVVTLWGQCFTAARMRMGCTVEAVVLRSALMIVSAIILVKLSTGTSMEHFSMSRNVRWKVNEVQPIKPTIVCLCGSTRFREAFQRVNRQETLAGRIVLAPGCFQGDDDVDWSSEVKQRLDELHLRKIDRVSLDPGG
jgi:hypothetical protein